MDPTAEQLVSRLRGDPNDADAYDALKAHYQAVGDLASLANLLEGWAAYQSVAALASDAYLEAARTARAAGADAARIKALYRQALHKDPGNAEATDELIALLEESDDQNELAEFLDGHLRTLETHDDCDPVFLAGLYARLGDLWKSAFERPDVARPCYERALELDPACTLAAYGARKLAQEAGDLEQVVRMYALEAEAEADLERKIQLYMKLAEVAANELGDLNGAVRALWSALALSPGDIQVMHQLAGYVAKRGASLSGEEAARDQRRVAELYYQIAQGVSSDEAVPYLEAALAAVPSHDGALALFEQLAKQLNQAELLPKYWVAYLAQAPDGPEVDQRRVYLAQAYQRAGQIEDAIYCLEQANSDAQVASLLDELKAQRGARASSPPGALSAEPQPQPQPQPQESERGDAPTVAPGHPSNRPTAKPPKRERAASPSERPLDVAPRLTQLRRQVHELVSTRRSDEAAVLCREILTLEPSDPEAFSLLESHYRKSRDHAQLKELLLASTRSGGLSIDARKLRSREVAAISEAKLKDVDGAIEAWQSVVALDPTDVDAEKNLKRLLQKAQRWDDLAGVLEREALATTSSQEKIDLLSQIAAIHRDKRKDLVEAAEALRQLLALKPDNALRDELCEMLLQNESYADAVPLMRARADEASDDREKHSALRALANTLDDKLADTEGAFDAYQQMLALRPKDPDVLERMQRIDEQSGNVTRLLSTLERRTMLASRADRPALFVRMGELAERELGEIDKAAEYYGNVLDLEPGHEGALGALYEMFERTGRYEDLVEALRERILMEKEPARRVELYRRVARMLSEHLGKYDDAAEAYQSLLAGKEDEEALRFLVERARTRGTAHELGELVPRLLPLLTDVQERKALLFEHAERLASELERPREAIVALREVVERIDPDFEPAIALLAELCERVDDPQALAVALDRQLERATDTKAQISLAKRLADLYEGKLADGNRAIQYLQRWDARDERNLEPKHRLQKLLTEASRYEELLETLDALASWEDDFEARDRATLQAARIAADQLGNVDAAWQRLAPLASECHPDAFALLEEIARKAGRALQLANLCVRAAQAASDADVQAQQWSAAARIYAQDLGDPQQALEASLRMLATDLRNRDYLAQVDGYAAAAGAWPRLNQVYDKLLKSAADDAERVDLLTRYATALDERASDPSEALDRILRACGLAPADEGLLARAEQLAKRADRTEELLVVYDRKRSKTADDLGKVEILLRAARLCDSALRDRERANNYLKSALTVAKATPVLSMEVVGAAEDLDREHPEHGENEALRSLVRAHREIAEKSDPEVGSQLVLRGHALLKDRLKDERAAFDLLRQGTSLFVTRDDLYEAFLEQATALKRLDAVDSHLSRAIDEAIDPKSAAILLSRRARLLEGPLGRAPEAADVFAKLLQLRPDDFETATKLRASLRTARRFQDLLLAIHKQLQRVKTSEEKLALLKETAVTWEQDLKNRWEALDAWRKVLDFAREDSDALAAVGRLDRRSALPPRPTAQLFDDEEEPTDPRGSLAAEATAEATAKAATSSDEAMAAEANASSTAAAASAPESDESSSNEPTTLPPPSAAAEPSPEASAPSEDADPNAADSDGLDALADELPAPESEPLSTTPPPAASDLLSTDVSGAKPTAANDYAMPKAAALGDLPALAAPDAEQKPPAQADIDIDLVDEPAEPLSSAPARLTKPPSLPARRSRSDPPPPSARTRSTTPPMPPPRSSTAPARVASLPPPLPGRAGRPSTPPSTAATQTATQTATQAAATDAPLGARTASLPPPLPPSARTGGRPPLPTNAAPSAPPSARTRAASRPPPLPSRKG